MHFMGERAGVYRGIPCACCTRVIFRLKCLTTSLSACLCLPRFSSVSALSSPPSPSVPLLSRFGLFPGVVWTQVMKCFVKKEKKLSNALALVKFSDMYAQKVSGSLSSFRRCGRWCCYKSVVVEMLMLLPLLLFLLSSMAINCPDLLFRFTRTKIHHQMVRVNSSALSLSRTRDVRHSLRMFSFRNVADGFRQHLPP